MTTPTHIETAEDHTRAALRDVGAAVVVACSAGTDSSLLAFLAAEAEVPARLIHVDHALTPASGAGVSAARALAARCGLELTVLRVDGDALRADPRGLEAAARSARYRALGAELRPGEVVATAHTATDRLTTVLMRIVQGTGMAALEGPVSRGYVGGVPVVRPMLHWWRLEVEQALAARDWLPHRDPENASDRYLRNRVEREVVEPLVALGDPRVIERSLRQIASDAQVFGASLDDELDAISRPTPSGGIVIGRLSLATVDAERRAALIARALRRLPVRPSRAMVERVSGLVESGRSYAGRGVRAEVGGDWMRVEPTENSRSELPPLIIGPLAIDAGDIDTCVGRLEVESARAGARPDGEFEAVVDLGRTEGDLVLRMVHQDESMWGLGSRGTRPVGALAKSAGVPLFGRRSLVAVCDECGPLWVPGVRRGRRALVDERTERALLLRWRTLA